MLILAILNKSAKTKVKKKIKTKLKIWKHKLKIVCIAEIYLKRVLGKGELTGESSFFCFFEGKKSSAGLAECKNVINFFCQLPNDSQTVHSCVFRYHGGGRTSFYEIDSCAGL